VVLTSSQITIHVPFALILEVLGKAQQRQLTLWGFAFSIVAYTGEKLPDDFMPPPGVARVVTMSERSKFVNRQLKKVRRGVPQDASIKRTHRLQTPNTDTHFVLITDPCFLPLADEDAYAAFVSCALPDEDLEAIECRRVVKLANQSDARTLLTMCAMTRYLAGMGMDVTAYYEGIEEEFAAEQSDDDESESETESESESESEGRSGDEA